MARERSKNREETKAVEPRGGQISRWDPWPSFGPFSMMRRWFDDWDRFFEDFGFPTTGRLRPWTASEAVTFSPHIDMYERDGKLVISADLPGLNKDELKVDITEDAVLIEGERRYENEEREEGVYRSERNYGRFRREIPLPEGAKTDTAEANFKNGVLEITMEAPHLAKTRRRIQIQGEEGQKAA